MSKLKLDRRILASFLPNHQAIAAFEQVFDDVGETLPTTIEEAAAQAVQALALANAALGALARMADELERVAAAPAQAGVLNDPDDFRPAVQYGSMAYQYSDAVDITGGTVGIDAGTVALPSLYLVDRTTGLYRAAADEWRMAVAGVDMITYKATGMTIAKPITSTVATGTAPFVVASTTLVANLHAAVADSLGTATTYPANATDLPTVIALANALKAANTAKGV